MRAKNILYGVEQARAVMRSLWPEALEHIRAGKRLEVEFREERRNVDQNSLLWKLLDRISEEVVWHGQKMEPEEWKDMATASLKKQKIVPGMSGGFVVVGSSTRNMTKSEMSELIEVIYAFGAAYGVEWEAEAA